MRDTLKIFLLSFFINIFLLTHNLNSGDAGELVTTAYFLGVAHPPGYPLYLMLAKIIQFIPFGNLAFRTALFSAFINSINSTIMYCSIMALTGSTHSALFGFLLLSFQYPFFTQSLIAKFYPLNLLVINIMLLLIGKFLVDYKHFKEISEKRILLTFRACGLLLGLMTALHHTGILMAIPTLLLLLFLVYKGEKVPLRTYAETSIAVSLGIIINVYVLIRGSKYGVFSPVTIQTFTDAFTTILRGQYWDGSTLSIVGKSLKHPYDLVYAIKNISFVTYKVLGIFIGLSFLGLIYMYRNHRMLFFFTSVVILLFGPFLAKITMTQANITERDAYVIANQYYLPYFYVLTLCCALGLKSTIGLLSKFPERVAKCILLLVSITPVAMFSERILDSNLRTNFVSYQASKDTLIILPIDAVFLADNDEAIFGTWYLKVLGRFRDDVCALEWTANEHKEWRNVGCSYPFRRDRFLPILNKEKSGMGKLIRNYTLFSNKWLEGSLVEGLEVKSSLASFLYLYTEKESPIDLENNPQYFDRSEFIRRAERVTFPDVCFEMLSDDYLSNLRCKNYLVHLIQVAQQNEGENCYGKKQINVVVSDPDSKIDVYRGVLCLGEENKQLVKTIVELDNLTKKKNFYFR